VAENEAAVLNANKIFFSQSTLRRQEDKSNVHLTSGQDQG